MSDVRVVLLGASGTMGRILVDLLTRELPEVRLVGAGRHPEHIALPEVRRLDLGDPASFPGALAGTRALVHAAGPFDHDPAPLVSACLAAGVDYLDLAEDPSFVVGAVRAAARPGARARAVPGCSTVPGLVALLARRFERLEDVASVDAHLSLGSRNPVSVGLLYGLLRPIGMPGDGGERWFSRIERFRFADGRVRSFGRYPIAVEKGLEVGLRTLPVRLFVGFDRAVATRSLQALTPLLPRLSTRRLRRLCEHLLPLVRTARAIGGREGRLALVARDAGGAERARLELLAASDGLEVPAAPVLWALRALLEQPGPAPGPVSLERLVEPAVALGWLRTRGYRVTEHGVA